MKRTTSKLIVPILLLLVTIASFGMLIPWLGFYWDDWPVMYMKQTQGIHGFWAFYQYDRPFSAWTYIVFSPILGTSPLAWQIFTLLLRWGAAVFLWAGLRLLWPRKSLQILWVALLFAVFPIFAQQPVPLEIGRVIRDSGIENKIALASDDSPEGPMKGQRGQPSVKSWES